MKLNSRESKRGNSEVRKRELTNNFGMVPQRRLSLKRFFRKDIEGGPTQPPVVQGSHYLRSSELIHWNLERCYLLFVTNVAPAQADEADTFAGGQEVASEKIISLRGRRQHRQDVVH